MVGLVPYRIVYHHFVMIQYKPAQPISKRTLSVLVGYIVPRVACDRTKADTTKMTKSYGRVPKLIRSLMHLDLYSGHSPVCYTQGYIMASPGLSYMHPVRIRPHCCCCIPNSTSVHGLLVLFCGSSDRLLDRISIFESLTLRLLHCAAATEGMVFLHSLRPLRHLFVLLSLSLDPDHVKPRNPVGRALNLQISTNQ